MWLARRLRDLIKRNAKVASGITEKLVSKNSSKHDKFLMLTKVYSYVLSARCVKCLKRYGDLLNLLQTDLEKQAFTDQMRDRFYEIHTKDPQK